jgi:hypothetical protein
MKKVSLFFVIFLALALSGCSISSINKAEAENEALKNKILDLEQQIIILKQEVAEISNASTISPIVQTNDLELENEAVSSENSLKAIETTIEDNLGYITKIYNKDEDEYLSIDYVQWIMGRDATVAAIEDGDCTVEGKTKNQALTEAKEADLSMELEAAFVLCAPNGYYIRNTNSMLRDFKISDNVNIEINDYGNPQKISLEKLISITDSYSDKENRLFSITLKDGDVVKIQEVYRP